jgi:organic radical activating enzyme
MGERVKVNEYFISIQGEGPEAGRRALFIRFSGCNLSCPWCDSKYALHTHLEVSAGSIADMIERSKCHYVVLTGGEPTIQEDLSQLLDWLSHANYQVDVETNGTHLPDKFRTGVRYIVSPKDFTTANDWWHYENTHINQATNFVFKFVVDIADMDPLFTWIKNHESNPVWLMPLTTNVKGKPDCMIDEMVTTGRIVQAEMIKRNIDGYLCTRLQNLYRVR